MDYMNKEVNSGPDSDTRKFFHKTQDLVLTQQIDKPTRVYHDQNPSLLDYIFTDEETSVKQVNDQVPIGKNDHICTTCNLKLEKPDISATVGKSNYWKGDYKAINQEFAIINQESEFSDQDVDASWDKFHQKLQIVG
jgi:hypothetical protein